MRVRAGRSRRRASPCARRTCWPAGPMPRPRPRRPPSPSCVPHHTSHLSARVERGGVHRLHGGVVLVRIRVDGLDLLGRAGDGGFDVAVLVADERRARPVEAFLQQLGDRLRWRPSRCRRCPTRSAAHRARSWRARRCRPPPRPRCRRPGRPSSRPASSRPWRRRSSSPCRRTPGTALIEALSIPGSLTSMPYSILPMTLSAVSSRCSGLPAIFQSFGSLSLTLLRHFQLGGGFGDLAVGESSCRTSVRDRAVRRRCIQTPAPSTRSPPPGSASCGRQRRLRAHTSATRGCRGCRRSRTRPRRACARDVLAGCRIFGRDLRPVALQFLGDKLGEAGQRALAHFGAGDADDHGVVGPDHDPDADLRRAVCGADHLAGRPRSRGRAPCRRRRRRCR